MLILIEKSLSNTYSDLSKIKPVEEERITLTNEIDFDKLPKEILQKLLFYIFDKSFSECKCFCDSAIALMEEIGWLSKVCKRWEQIFTSKYFIYDFFKKYHNHSLNYGSIDPNKENNNLSQNANTKNESFHSCAYCFSKLYDKRKLIDFDEFCRTFDTICANLKETRNNVYDGMTYDVWQYSQHSSVALPNLSTDIEIRTTQFMNAMGQLYPFIAPRLLEGPNVVPITREELLSLKDEPYLPEHKEYVENNPDEKQVSGFLSLINQKVDKMKITEIDDSYAKIIEQRKEMFNNIVNRDVLNNENGKIMDPSELKSCSMKYADCDHWN